LALGHVDFEVLGSEAYTTRMGKGSAVKLPCTLVVARSYGSAPRARHSFAPTGGGSIFNRQRRVSFRPALTAAGVTTAANPAHEFAGTASRWAGICRRDCPGNALAVTWHQARVASRTKEPALTRRPLLAAVGDLRSSATASGVAPMSAAFVGGCRIKPWSGVLLLDEAVPQTPGEPAGSRQRGRTRARLPLTELDEDQALGHHPDTPPFAAMRTPRICPRRRGRALRE